MVARWRCQFWAECMTNISEAGKALLEFDVAAALIAMRL